MAKTAEAPPEPEQLGDLIRRYRKEQGLRQEDLGAKVGEDWRYIGAVERGELEPPLRRLTPIVRALDIPCQEVFASVEATDPPSAHSSCFLQTASDLARRAVSPALTVRRPLAA